MPVETRAPDSFTIDNFILGFPQVTFQARAADGSLDPVVSLGILASAELQKEVELLEMEDGSSGTSTTALELVSKLKPQFELGVFNFRHDLAQFIFGSSVDTEVSAATVALASPEAVAVPTGTLPTAAELFTPLVNGNILETGPTPVLTAATVTQVILGDGTGTALGDFSLSFKVFALADVDNGTTLEFTETNTTTGALVTTYTVQVGAPVGAGQAQLVVGTGADSGDLDLDAVVPVGNQLNITFTPSFAYVEDLTADPDMVLSPLLGQIRFPDLDTAAAKTAGPIIRTGQDMLLQYSFTRFASHLLKPFTQGGGSFNGIAVIKHLPDVGSNFIWDNIDATIRIDDNALTFGSDDFVQGTVVLVLNDAGGTQRFGDLRISNQSESAS